MKNVVVTFLFVLFILCGLLPKVGFEQSFKANELLKHFQEHKKIEKSNFNFVDFLWLHYAADSKHSKTSNHPSLPSIDFNGIIGYVIPLLYFLSIWPILILLTRKKDLQRINLYHFSLSRVLIAPPRA
jgi:hypothetical protein